MFGRLNYYFGKAKTKLRQRGPVALFRQVFLFLIRRKFFLQFLFESIEYHLLSRGRDVDGTIIQIFKNEPITSKRVLLYASYDKKSEMGEHILFQLKAFQSEGYQVVFVTTAPTVPFFEFNKIKDLVSICVHRKNIGYDFVSWKVGQKFIGEEMTGLESLILMNDSCLGPLYDFGPSLKSMGESKDSVYGLSKSEEIYPHIQSYFYHFGSDVLQRRAAVRFFARIRILNTKWGIVRYFEIGSSRFLQREKISLRALVDPQDPRVQEKMKKAGLSEPTREPLASEWIKLKLIPFYKRSNLGLAESKR